MLTDHWRSFIEKYAREQVQLALAKGGQLTDLHVEEVSAVDRPANRRKFLVVKRDETTKADASPRTLGERTWRALEIMAKSIQEHDPSLTTEAAIARAMDEAPLLVKAYNAGQARGEPLEFAPEPVEKAEPETPPAWAKIERLAKVKLEKGEASTIEQAAVLVGNEHPDLYRQACSE